MKIINKIDNKLKEKFANIKGNKKYKIIRNN